MVAAGSQPMRCCADLLLLRRMTRAGFILYVDAYPACVAFYRDVLDLPVLFETPDLTCFTFGASYLMVEINDEGSSPEAGPPFRSCLRLNVPDVHARAEALRAHGVGVDVQVHPWGTVAKFTDPDGNLCAFKDDATFERQVEGGRSTPQPRPLAPEA